MVTQAALVKNIARELKSRGWRCAVAESCTGGALAQALTDCPGSSLWFERGFVTYSNEAKQALLGVSAKTLAEAGAVSEAVVREMAEGALRVSPVQATIAISGIAGPDGGMSAVPVGTVWIAWSFQGKPTTAHCFHFKGNRRAVRKQAVDAALSAFLVTTPHSIHEYIGQQV